MHSGSSTDQVAPLSFAQERLWFIDAAAPGAATYNVPLLLRWTEPVDVPALRAALATVAARHEVLRTTFGLRDARPVQVIHSGAMVPTLVCSAPDRRSVRDDALRRARDPFDLAGAPPARCVVWHCPEGDAVLLCLHHIAIDGWSVAPLLADLAQSYAAARLGRSAELGPPPSRYAEFAARERAGFDTPALAGQLDRRVEQLLRVDGDLTLPGHRGAAPAGYGERRGEQHRFGVGEAVWASVRKFATANRATPFVVLSAALTAVLRRWYQRPEFVVGTLTANRFEPEFEDSVGFFVNTVPLLCHVPDGVSFRELCAGTRAESFAALSHQRLPYEKVLAAARKRGAGDLVTVAFALQNFPPPSYPVPPPWLEPEQLPTGTAKYDLLLLFEESAGGLTGTIELDVDRYPIELAGRLAENIVVLLEAALADPDRPVRALPITRAGTGTVLSGPFVPRPPTILDVLAERFAGLDPHAPAVSVNEDTISWQVLDDWSAVIAAALPEDRRVPVIAGRGGGMVAAWLGVLRAGAAYVPLSVDAPPDRAAHILREVGARTALADADGAKLLGELGLDIRVVRIDELRTAAPAGAPAARPGPDDPALILYTSGTTGRPKGVVLPHRGLVNTALWWAEEFGLGPADRVLCTWSTQFDCATFDTFRCLAAGAHLVFADDIERRDPDALLRHIRGPAGATVTSMTPSLLRAMLDADQRTEPSTLRALTVAGEAMTQPLVTACTRKWDTLVNNSYGPAEASCFGTSGWIEPSDERPTIGLPIPNTRCYLLGAEGEELPQGVPGEIYLAGTGIGLGYLAQPDRTAASFLPDPHRPGETMYRTGDRGAVRPDGTLGFLGRFDDQVKILGNRIEPAEVRGLLEAHQGVRAAAVTTDAGRLVAFVVLDDPGDPPSRTELVAPLLRWLPPAALPAVVYAVDTIPLNRNDKVDFAALRTMRGVPLPAGAGRQAMTADEARAAAIMAGVLGVRDGLTPEANFFGLGGHSLLAVQVVAAAQRDHGVSIALRDFLADPTVAGLGRLLAGPVAAPAPKTVADQAYPATSVQQRLWFLDRVPGFRPAYLVPILIELTGPVDVDRLRAAVAAVLGRHPALRSRFTLDVKRRAVFYRTDGPPPAVEVTGGPAGLDEFCWTPFDLAAGSPVRARIMTDGDRTVLAVVTHHIVFDGWSWDVLADQLGRAYRDPAAELAPPVHPAALTGPEASGADAVIARLAGAPTDVTLPLDHPRPEVQPVDGETVVSIVDSTLTARLRAGTAALGCSTFVTSAALLAATLARHGTQRDFLFAFPWSGRDRAASLHAVGMFVNTLVLRVDLRDAPTWRELLIRVREQAADCYRTADVPFGAVAAALHPGRDLSRPPLTPVYLGVFDAEPVPPDLGAPITARYLPLPGMRVKYELDLTVTDRGQDLELVAAYPTALWTSGSVTRLLDSFVAAAADLAADPDTAVLTGETGG